MGENAARNRGNKMRVIGLNEDPIKIPTEGTDAHGRESIIVKAENPTKIDEVNTELYYMGYAEYGSSDDDDVWKIRKFQKVGRIWEEKYAYGNQYYRYKWSDRMVIPYA